MIAYSLISNGFSANSVPRLFAEGGQNRGDLFSFRGPIGVSEARSERASAVGKEPVRPAAEATVLAIWFCRGAIRPRAKIGCVNDRGTFSPHEETEPFHHTCDSFSE